MWVRKTFLIHQQKGIFNVLIKHLCLSNHENFLKFFQINSRIFYLLLFWVGPHIRRSSLRREVARPVDGLCVTQCYGRCLY